MDPLANETNPWAPAEDAATILAEHAWLQGVVLSAVAYGAEFILFCMCFYFVYRQTTHESKWKTIALLTYISVLFILGSLFMGSLAQFTQLAFIDNRNFPGGPSAYENTMFSIPVDEVGNVAFTLSNALCDGLIVWRCMAIYSGCRFPRWAIMFLPCLLLLASITTGILYLVQISTTGPYGQPTVNWTIPYFSLSLSLNILITIAISSRLLIYRSRITRVLGPSHGSQYISIATMVVESASIYSAYSLFFLIPFALDSSISSISLQSLTQVQTCATLLIIFRVASGKGWNEKVQSTLTDFKVKARSSSFVAGGNTQTSTNSRIPKPSKSNFIILDNMVGRGPVETAGSDVALSDLTRKNDEIEIDDGSLRLDKEAAYIV